MFWKEFFSSIYGIFKYLISLILFILAFSFMFDSGFSFWGIICGIGGILVMIFGIPSISVNNETNNNSTHDNSINNTANNFWETFNHLPRDMRINLYNDYLKKR